MSSAAFIYTFKVAVHQFSDVLLFLHVSVLFYDCVLGVSHPLLNAWVLWLIRCPFLADAFIYSMCAETLPNWPVWSERPHEISISASCCDLFFPHCCFALQSWRSLTKSTCTSWGYHRRTDVDMAVWTPLVQFQPVLVFLQGVLVQEESKKQEIRGALTREQLWAFTLIREHHFSAVRHQTPRCHHLEAIHVGFFFTVFDETPMQVHIERLFSLTQRTVQIAHFAHSGGW